VADMTINLDISTLRKYWLSISATAIGIWTSLNPAAQQKIIHYVATAVHGHPTLTVLAGLASLVLADLKQSPLASPAPPAK
jgi:hypothetical protein